MLNKFSQQRVSVRTTVSIIAVLIGILIPSSSNAWFDDQITDLDNVDDNAICRFAPGMVNGNSSELKNLLTARLTELKASKADASQEILVVRMLAWLEVGATLGQGNLRRATNLLHEDVDLMRANNLDKEKIVDGLIELAEMQRLDRRFWPNAAPSFRSALSEAACLQEPAATRAKLKVLKRWMQEFPHDIDVRNQLELLLQNWQSDDAASLRARAEGYQFLCSTYPFAYLGQEKRNRYLATACNLFQQAGLYAQAFSISSFSLRIGAKELPKQKSLIEGAIKNAATILPHASEREMRLYLRGFNHVLKAYMENVSPKDLSLSLKNWLSAITVIPNSMALQATLNLHLGDAYVKLGLLDKSITKYRDCIEQLTGLVKERKTIGPMAEKLRLRLAKRKAGDKTPIGFSLDEYMIAFRESLSLDPMEDFHAYADLNEAQFQLFKVYCRVGDLQQAEKLYAVLQSEEHGKGWYVRDTPIMLADLYAKHGDMTNARALCATAISHLGLNFCSLDPDKDDERRESHEFLGELNDFSKTTSALSGVPYVYQPSEGKFYPESMSEDELIGAVISFLAAHPSPGDAEKIAHLRHAQAMKKEDSRQTDYVKNLVSLREAEVAALEDFDDDPAKALGALRQAIQTRRKIEGDVAEISASLNEDGSILLEHGYCNDAEDYLSDSLKIREHGGAAAKTAVAQTLCNLGQL